MTAWSKLQDKASGFHFKSHYRTSGRPAFEIQYAGAITPSPLEDLGVLPQAQARQTRGGARQHRATTPTQNPMVADQYPVSRYPLTRVTSLGALSTIAVDGHADEEAPPAVFSRATPTAPLRMTPQTLLDGGAASYGAWPGTNPRQHQDIRYTTPTPPTNIATQETTPAERKAGRRPGIEVQAAGGLSRAPEFFSAQQYDIEIEKCLMRAQFNLSELNAKSVDGVLASTQWRAQLRQETSQAFRKIDRLMRKDELAAKTLPLQQSTAKKQQLQAFQQAARKKVQKQLTQLYAKEGWRGASANSDLKWESGTGPLLTRKGAPIRTVMLKQAGIAKGGFASVSVYSTANGKDIAVKIPHEHMHFLFRPGDENDLLKKEADVYEKLYRNQPFIHPNIVNTHGIATMKINGQDTRVLVMDNVEGPDGANGFDMLASARDRGQISPQEYVACMASIAQQMLSATRHFSEAGIVHNDIRPDNFVIDRHTGNTVLVDFGLATGKNETTLTKPRLSSPEVRENAGVDEKSDVYMIATALLQGIGRDQAISYYDAGGKYKAYVPNDGYRAATAAQQEGQRLIEAAGFQEFIEHATRYDRQDRPDADQALDEPFIQHLQATDIDPQQVLRELFSGKRGFISTEPAIAA